MIKTCSIKDHKVVLWRMGTHFFLHMGLVSCAPFTSTINLMLAVITSIIKFGVKLHIHSQISTMEPLTFDHGQVIHPHFPGKVINKPC